MTKHFLTKVINKLNAFIESSDYQVTAYLMNMPSMITFEIFQYCEIYRIINYCSYLIKNKKLNTDENSLNILEEEKTKLISNYKELILKYVQTFVLERREGTNEDINKSLPVISYYFNWGNRVSI